ncbi:hypothetical protein ACHQM5_026390 [Ranunculus cassubicifolius]
MHILVMMITLVILLFSSLTSVTPLDTCSKCGNMEVPYPLSTTNTCGDPRYSVYCNNGILEFSSTQGFYYKIQSINANSNSLVISPPTISIMLLNCSDTILLSPLNCSSNSLCRQFEDRVEEGNVCRNTLCCTFLKDASITSRRIRVRVGGCSAYTSIQGLKNRYWAACRTPRKRAESPLVWKYGIELQWLPPN